MRVSYFSPILFRANLSLSGDNKMTDSPGCVPRVEIESVICLLFRPLILAYSFRIVPHAIDESSVLQEANSYDIPLQRVLIELPCNCAGRDNGIPRMFKKPENCAGLEERLRGKQFCGLAHQCEATYDVFLVALDLGLAFDFIVIHQH